MLKSKSLVEFVPRNTGLRPIAQLDGVTKLLPARIYDPNRFSAIRSYVYNLVLSNTNTPSTDIFLKIHSILASKGIAELSQLGKYTLGGKQTWVGGQFLVPQTGFTAQRAETLSNIDEFWIAADEIDISNTLNAVIRVTGTVILVANKISVEPGSKISWYPQDPFSENQFDWKDSLGNPIAAANGAHGAAGSGHTWSPSQPPADKAGKDGRTGDPGLPGYRGPDAPSLILFAKEITNLPITNLSGFRGGDGQNGGNGGNGGKGDKGEPAESSHGFNTRGCGWGGNGGSGGNAGRGGVGGPGGAGGDVLIYCLQATKDSLTSGAMSVQLQPGPGGNGGAPGRPGVGGPGGDHGDRVGWGEIDDTQRNGNPGAPGTADTTPPSLLKGPDGTLFGSLIFNVVTAAQIDAAFNAPAIIGFFPNSGVPGTLIQLTAVNVPEGTEIFFGNAVIATAGWTMSGNTAITTFTVPENSPGGSVSVFLVDASGNHVTQYPEGFLVLPRLDSSLGEARFGSTLTLAGAGFSNYCKVLIGGTQTVSVDFTNSNEIKFTIPSPAGAFEQNAGSKTVSVINQGGYQSNDITISFDHWLHLGFEPGIDDFQFDNSSTTIQAANVSIDLDLFTQTFGQDDREILAPDNPGSLLADLEDPARSALGWIFFGIYVAFLDSAPGICNGMSAFALDRYFSGGPPLHQAEPNLSGNLARTITALQGRVLSLQALDGGIRWILANTISGDVWGSRSFFSQLETAIRGVVQGNTVQNRKNYPLLNFLPTYQGITDTFSFFERVGEDHTILPYAIRYPTAGEDFFARIYCCNNWDHNNNFVRIEIQKDFSFSTQLFSDARGKEYDTDARYDPLTSGDNDPVFQSKDGWGLSPMPMSIAFYDNVDMPTNIFACLSPVIPVIDAGNGRVIGKKKGDLFSQAELIVPSPRVRGLFRVGQLDQLTVTINGKDKGIYSAGFSNVSKGNSAGVLNIKTAEGQSDSVKLDLNTSKVVFNSRHDINGFKMASCMKTPIGTREAVVTALRLKKNSVMEMDVSGERLNVAGPDRSLSSAWMKFENVFNQSATQTIDLRKTGGAPLTWVQLASKIMRIPPRPGIGD